MLEKYNKCKNKLEEIYDNIAGVKVGSKILWYEEEEKSSKFFLILEKTIAVQDIMKKLEIENKKNKGSKGDKQWNNFLKKKSYSQRLCESHCLKLITFLRISFFPF